MMRSIIQRDFVLILVFFKRNLHFTTILSYFSQVSMKIAYFGDFLLECYLYYVW
jgi:hypothetical protein